MIESFGFRKSDAKDEIPPGSFEAELSDSQKGGIRKSIQMGRELQRTHPQIADDYRNSMSLSEIIRTYSLDRIFGDVSHKTAEMAVLHALRGYGGEINLFEEEAYGGLLEDDEAASLGQLHQSENARKTDQEMKKSGGGLYSITKEQRKEIGQRSGLAQAEKKIGIHAQTPEERRELAMKGLTSQGKLPFSEREMQMIFDLVSNPKFQRNSRINAQKITQELNSIFYDGKQIRNPRQVVKFFSRMKSEERDKKTEKE